jgi:hypothetical protein
VRQLCRLMRRVSNSRMRSRAGRNPVTPGTFQMDQRFFGKSATGGVDEKVQPDDPDRRLRDVGGAPICPRQHAAGRYRRTPDYGAAFEWIGHRARRQRHNRLDGWRARSNPSIIWTEPFAGPRSCEAIDGHRRGLERAAEAVSCQPDPRVAGAGQYSRNFGRPYAGAEVGLHERSFDLPCSMNWSNG